MSMLDRAVPRERGETLIELMAAVLILATAVVAVIGALFVAIKASDQHRKEATAGAAVRDFAETLERGVASVPTQYHPCGTTAEYLAMYTTAPANYTPYVDGITVWDGTGFVAVTYPPQACNDQGIQKLSLRVSTDGNTISESLDVVLRLPCRPGVDSCEP